MSEEKRREITVYLAHRVADRRVSRSRGVEVWSNNASRACVLCSKYMRAVSQFSLNCKEQIPNIPLILIGKESLGIWGRVAMVPGLCSHSFRTGACCSPAKLAWGTSDPTSIGYLCRLRQELLFPKGKHDQHPPLTVIHQADRPKRPK